MVKEKVFDRDIRESGLTRYKFHLELDVEVGDVQPGSASNNTIGVIAEKMERYLGLRPTNISLSSYKETKQ